MFSLIDKHLNWKKISAPSWTKFKSICVLKMILSTRYDLYRNWEPFLLDLTVFKFSMASSDFILEMYL